MAHCNDLQETVFKTSSQWHRRGNDSSIDYISLYVFRIVIVTHVRGILIKHTEMCSWGRQNPIH
jgi:hypothetical protein